MDIPRSQNKNDHLAQLCRFKSVDENGGQITHSGFESCTKFAYRASYYIARSVIVYCNAASFY